MGLDPSQPDQPTVSQAIVVGICTGPFRLTGFVADAKNASEDLTATPKWRLTLFTAPSSTQCPAKIMG